MQNNDLTSVPIIILAGGQSQRLRLDNKYKWQLPFFGGKSLLQYIIDKASKQSKQVLINAPFHQGDNTADKAPHLNDYALPLIHDLLPNFQGPLAGLLTSLDWAKQQHYPWVATIACDTPFFPYDLLKKLISATEEQQNPNKPPLAVTVSSGGRLHPIFGLWSTQLFNTLQKQITQPYTRSISRWAQEHAKIIEVDLIQHGEQTINPFLNINTLTDYQHALTVVNQLHLNNAT